MRSGVGLCQATNHIANVGRISSTVEPSSSGKCSESKIHNLLKHSVERANRTPFLPYRG